MNILCIIEVRNVEAQLSLLVSQVDDVVVTESVDGLDEGLVYTMDREVGPWKRAFLQRFEFMIQLSWSDFLEK